jgi:hypothetical protein
MSKPLARDTLPATQTRGSGGAPAGQRLDRRFPLAEAHLDLGEMACEAPARIEARHPNLGGVAQQARDSVRSAAMPPGAATGAAA